MVPKPNAVMTRPCDHRVRASAFTRQPRGGEFLAYASGRHAEGLHIELEDRLLLLALGIILLAQGDDLADRLGVEAGALGFGVDFLDVAGDARLLFFEALDALDERL